MQAIPLSLKYIISFEKKLRTIDLESIKISVRYIDKKVITQKIEKVRLFLMS